MWSQMVNTKKCKTEPFLAEMAEHYVLKCTEESRHDTEVKPHINFGPGTVEFSDTCVPLC